MKKRILPLIAATTIAFSGAVQASTSTSIDFMEGGTVYGTATCSISCQGLLADGSLSSNMAFATNIGSSSEQNEVDTLNSWLDPNGTFVVGDASKENNGNSPFSFFGEYVALKIGPRTGYLFNTAGVTQTVSYVGFQQGGLSHKTNIGGVEASVPLPAAGLLMLSAAGGLGALRARRKS